MNALAKKAPGRKKQNAVKNAWSPLPYSTALPVAAPCYLEQGKKGRVSLREKHTLLPISDMVRRPAFNSAQRTSRHFCFWPRQSKYQTYPSMWNSWNTGQIHGTTVLKTLGIRQSLEMRNRLGVPLASSCREFLECAQEEGTQAKYPWSPQVVERHWSPRRPSSENSQGKVAEDRELQRETQRAIECRKSSAK